MSLLDKCKLINFANIGDLRGNLVAIEGCKSIPFDIKRVFYIYDTDSEVIRGQHANRKSEFVLICIHGTLKIKVSDSKEERIFLLNSPNEGLYVPKMIWKDMYDFSQDSILLVLANTYYDASEYIKDFVKYNKEIIGSIIE